MLPHAINQMSIRFLIELGFGIGLVDSQSPLHEAAFNGHLDLVKELVEIHGCNRHLRDLQFSSTPLGWAMQSEQLEIIEYLSALDLDIFDGILIDDANRVGHLIDTDTDVIERRFREHLDSEEFQ